MKKERINSLEALRCFAFLGVFVCHIGDTPLSAFGAWGVSIFFILSGFVFTLSYYKKDRLESPTVKSSFRFVLQKIKKLYPLHIICMLAMCIFSFVGDDTMPLSRFTLYFGLNTLLFQEWFPLSERSFNGVSWYLCTYVFSCFLFPWVLKRLEKKTTYNGAIRNIVICFIIQAIIGLIGRQLPNNMNIDWLENDMTYWFVYRFPLCRFVDFIIGCNLFVIFNNSKMNLSKRKATALEIISIVFSLSGVVLKRIFQIKNDMVDDVYVAHRENWWLYVIVFTLGSVFIIYSFAKNEGRISKLLTNKVTLYLAKIGAYGFLTHMVIFRYIQVLLVRLPIFGGRAFDEIYGPWIRLTIGFIITIISVELWIRLENKVKDKLSLIHSRVKL